MSAQTGRDPRTGWRWTTIRNQFIARCKQADAHCWLCGQPINYQAKRSPLAPELDHVLPYKTHPHLVYEQANWRVAHARCNHSRGARTPRKRQPDPQAWTRASW